MRVHRKMARFVLALLVAGVLGAARGGGDDDIGVSDLEGSWEAESLTVTSNDNPDMSMDLISLGGVMTLEADGSGNVSGVLTVPPAQGGPADVPFAGTWIVHDQETMGIEFDPEIPPLLINYRGPFTLEGDTLTVTDEDAPFDFSDGTQVSATSSAVFVRSSQS